MYQKEIDMPKEIERKFLLKDSSWKKLAEKYDVLKIKQGYISSENGKVVRIRHVVKESQACYKTYYEGYITIKGPTKGISRDEFEYHIPDEDAIAMLKMCDRVISKTRYHIPLGLCGDKIDSDRFWEIDVFHGDNKGLVVAEIELESEKEMVIIPSFIGKEVTDDRKYSNSNLVKNPYKNWKKK